MKASDFNLTKELHLDVERGIATFRNNRMVIMDTSALGYMRQNLVHELGVDKARSFFLRMGYAAGTSDFSQMKQKCEFDNEMELLASGPVIHTWEGIVKAIPTALRFDRQKSEFHFTGRWLNSYEAEQYLSFNTPASEPVCWSLMGYASGWGTAFFGQPLLAVEPHCCGKGDAECGWLIKPLSQWGDNAQKYIAALRPLYGV